MNSPAMHDDSHRAGWNILAELEPPPGTNPESQVRKWLFETLRLAELQQDVMNKVIGSAQDSLTGIDYANPKEVKAPVVQLRVYIPTDAPSQSGRTRNWGFFRIVKRGFDPAVSERHTHLIEFFLYPE